MIDASSLGGAILAAGDGRRFREAGWTMPKPLVPVAGIPLIEHVLRHFVAAGITSLAIILNEESRDCVRWIRTRFPDLALQFVVKTTRSSFESFEELLRVADRPRTLISTVDGWCPDREFVRFAETAQTYPLDATVLAVTPLVADERPLWVSLDGEGRVTRLGAPHGDLVTAGIYLVPEHLRRSAPPAPMGRLRDFLVWLVAEGEPVYGVVVPSVVDVDRPEDVRLAEALVARVTAVAPTSPEGTR